MNKGATEIRLLYLTAPFTPGYYYIYNDPSEPELSKGNKEHGPFKSKERAIEDASDAGVPIIDETGKAR